MFFFKKNQKGTEKMLMCCFLGWKQHAQTPDWGAAAVSAIRRADLQCSKRCKHKTYAVVGIKRNKVLLQVGKGKGKGKLKMKQQVHNTKSRQSISGRWPQRAGKAHTLRSRPVRSPAAVWTVLRRLPRRQRPLFTTGGELVGTLGELFVLGGLACQECFRQKKMAKN